METKEDPNKSKENHLLGKIIKIVISLACAAILVYVKLLAKGKI